MATLNLKRLIALTVLTAGAALAQAQPMGHGGHGGPDMMGGNPRMMHHLLKEVGATDAQMAQIKTIFQTAMKSAQAQHETLKTLHTQGEALMAAPVIDSNAVMALHAQAQTARDAIGTTMAQAMISAANVLTPAQRAQIYAIQQKHEAHMAEHAAQWKAHHAASAATNGQ